MPHAGWLAAATALACSAPVGAQAGVDPPARQALEDAWWTGPMLANSAATLPRGHALVETYLYDVHGAQGDALGTITYLMYGVTDALTLGLRPSLGYAVVKGGRDSSGVGFGDLTVLAQHRLTRFDAARGVPALSVSLQASVPTGRYDRLGARTADGFGGGAWGGTVALYAQHYWWLPNGRILRGRLNLSGTAYARTTLRDVSVYGTAQGFRGRARPGGAVQVGGSLEYSATRRVALALDALYTHGGATEVVSRGAEPVRYRLPGSDAIGLAPGVEYSWTSRLGVLLAARFVPKGRNASSSLTPTVAINAVF